VFWLFCGFLVVWWVCGSVCGGGGAGGEKVGCFFFGLEGVLFGYLGGWVVWEVVLVVRFGGGVLLLFVRGVLGFWCGVGGGGGGGGVVLRGWVLLGVCCLLGWFSGGFFFVRFFFFFFFFSFFSPFFLA